MNDLFRLLVIFGLTFLIQNSDGPWGLIALSRNKLMNNKYVGVFFYKLLSCPFCTGCHASYIVYLATTNFKDWTVPGFVSWALAGGAFCYILTAILDKLQSE